MISSKDSSIAPNSDTDVFFSRTRHLLWLVGHPTMQFCFSSSTWNRFAVHMPLHKTRRIPTANPGRAKHPNHRYDLCHEMSADRSQDFGGTFGKRYSKISVLDRVTEHRWESQQFCQLDPYGTRTHRPPWCCKPLMSSRIFLPFGRQGVNGGTVIVTHGTNFGRAKDKCARIGGRSIRSSKANDTNPTYVDTKATDRSRP